MNRAASRIAVTLCMILLSLSLACTSGDENEPENSGGPPRSVETQEELARLAVEALKAGSLEPFEVALPTAGDYEDVLECLRRAEGEEKYRLAVEGAEKSGGLEAIAERMRERCREGLDGLLGDLPGALGTVDWSKANFDGINQEESRLRLKDGVQGGDIHFRVKVGEKRYDFVLMTCMNLERGWVCGEGIRISLSMEDAHGGRASPSAGTPNAMARMAYEALKSSSRTALRPVCPTIADMEELLETMRESAGDEAYEAGRKDLEERGGVEKVAEEYRKDIAREVKTTRENLAKAVPPIDWSKAKFGGIIEDETKRSENQGIEKVDFYFWVTCGEVKYAIKIDDCFKMSRGWITMDGIRYNESRSVGLTERAR